MLAQLYKLLQVNPVLTLELWLIHFRTVGHLSFGFLVADHQLINMLYQLLYIKCYVEMIYSVGVYAHVFTYAINMPHQLFCFHMVA